MIRQRAWPLVDFSGSPLATFSAHTASPPHPNRTPAGSRASSRHASIAPRTTLAHGPPGWAAPRTHTHRSTPAPPTPAGASRRPRAVPYPTPASAAERPFPDPRVRVPRSNRCGRDHARSDGALLGLFSRVKIVASVRPAGHEIARRSESMFKRGCVALLLISALACAGNSATSPSTTNYAGTWSGTWQLLSCVSPEGTNLMTCGSPFVVAPTHELSLTLAQSQMQLTGTLQLTVNFVPP